MAKKGKLALQADDDLKQVDTELDAALTALETANRRVDELLESHFQTAGKTDQPEQTDATADSPPEAPCTDHDGD